MSIVSIKFQYQELTENDIVEEHFEIIESVSSGNELRYGGCESTCVKFTAIYSDELKKAKGKSFGLTYYDKFYGAFKINSVKVSDNRATIEVIAYDYLYEMMNTDISSWFNEKLTGTTGYSFGQVWRELFDDVLGYNYENITLRNDSVRFPEPDTANEKITAGQFMKIICELNGVFGCIDSHNKFVFKKYESSFDNNIYPSLYLYPGAATYPTNYHSEKAVSTIDTGMYYDLKHEDFEVKQINRYVIELPKAEAGYGTGNNKYIVKSNQITKYLGYVDAVNIAANAMITISPSFYMPIEKATVIYMNEIEPLKNIQFVSIFDEFVPTIILSVTHTGIYAPKSIIVSKGVEYYSN